MELRHDDASLANEFKNLIEGTGFGHMSFMVINCEDGLGIVIASEEPLNEDDEADFIEVVLDIHRILRDKYVITPGMRFLFNLNPSQIIPNYDSIFETTYDDADIEEPINENKERFYE